MVVMAFCDMPQKSQKQFTDISLKQFVALSGEPPNAEQKHAYDVMQFHFPYNTAGPLLNQVHLAHLSEVVFCHVSSMRDPEDPYGQLLTKTDKTGRSPDPAVALVPNYSSLVGGPYRPSWVPHCPFVSTI